MPAAKDWLLMEEGDRVDPVHPFPQLLNKSLNVGLKPVRAFLFCFTSLPKPGKTNSPFFFVVCKRER